MTIARAPWVAAFAMSLAIHAGVLLWLFPADDVEAEIGRGAGSMTEGSVDAIAGQAIRIETMETSEAVTAPADDVPPAAAAAEAVQAVPAPAIAPPAAQSAVQPATVSQSTPAAPAPDLKAVEPVNAPPAEIAEAAVPAATSPVETMAAADPVDAIPPGLVAAVPSASVVAVDPAPAEATLARDVPAETTPVRDPELAAVEPAPPAPVVKPPEPAQPARTVERTKDRTKEAPVKRDRRKETAAPQAQGAGAIDSRRGAAVADANSRARDAGSGRARQAGEGASNWTSYEGSVRGKLKRGIRYPSASRSRGVTGVATVSFTVSADGSASHIVLTQSSGDAKLDEAALATVRRASPFEPLPAGLGKSHLITAPLVFNLGR